MSYTAGTATDVADLLVKLDAFLCVGHSLDPIYSGSGTGSINGLIGTAASVLETITVTFSDATNFSVSGSVSGNLGSGTVGTAFSCAVCSITIASGSTPWASGDTISFIMTPPWVHQRFSATANNTSLYCCWRAPGNDGTSAIHLAVQRISDVTGDYDNLRLNAYTSYNAGLSFFGQTGGFSSKGPVLPLLRVGNMPYWITANGRRAVIVVKVSTVYVAAYLGLITPYLNPAAMPYPVFIGGSMAYDGEPAATSTNWRWSVTSNFISTFPKAYGDSQGGAGNYPARFRRIDGVWAAFSGIGRYPTPGYGQFTPDKEVGTDLRPGPDGSYPILPFVLSESSPANVWGELDGVGWVSGHANTAENIITENRIPWLVVQDIFRTTKNSYFAVKLA